MEFCLLNDRTSLEPRKVASSFVVFQEMVLSVIPRQPHYEKKFYLKKNAIFLYEKKKNNNNNNSNFTTYFIIITYLKTLSMVVFCNNRQAFLNKLQRQWLLLVLHCFMGRFQSGLQSFKMAALEEELPISVLFMFGEEKIKANINFGASRSDLIEAFQISTTNDLILQHYDDEWEEWINLPDEFTASTKIKLKFISKPSVPVQLNLNLETKSHSSKQATLKASSGS